LPTYRLGEGLCRQGIADLRSSLLARIRTPGWKTLYNAISMTETTEAAGYPAFLLRVFQHVATQIIRRVSQPALSLHRFKAAIG
jgi:hypothetical protein